MDYRKEPHGLFMVIDNKSFYASVECIKLGLNPLTTALVVLSEQPNTNGGLILATSPRAKKDFGIKNVSRQRNLPNDPELIVVPPRMNLYIEKSLEINRIFHHFAAEKDCYPYSIDETIVDMTHSWHLFGKTPEEVARNIQLAVRNQLGLYTTVGIGDNPLQAKLALDLFAKHTHEMISRLTYENFAKKIWPITDLTKVWSIGDRTAAHLVRMGIFSMDDLAHTDPRWIRQEMGVIGLQLFALAWGIDRSKLDHVIAPKAVDISNSQVLPRDYRTQTEIEVVIKEIGEQVASRLRHRNKKTTRVSLWIGYSFAAAEETGSGGFAHQIKIDPTDSTRVLNRYLLKLFEENWQGETIRNVGVSFGDLVAGNEFQLNLFLSPKKQLKQFDLDKVVDEIRDRYGTTSLFYTHSLLDGGTMRQRAGLVGGHNGGNAFD